MDLYRGQRVFVDGDLIPASVLVDSEGGKIRGVFRSILDANSDAVRYITIAYTY